MDLWGLEGLRSGLGFVRVYCCFFLQGFVRVELRHQKSTFAGKSKAQPATGNKRTH